MADTLSKVHQLASEGIEKAQSLDELLSLKRRYLSKTSGEITQLIQSIPNQSASERREFGNKVNRLKTEMEKALAEREKQLMVNDNFKDIDPTAPGIPVKVGHLHPITQAIEEISRIFENIGFVRQRYPEIETDWYAFEGLNMPENHPARDEWETFFISDGIVMTPHTSSGQLREMEKKDLPIRMMNISRCDRRQSDVSHAPTFYQFEGLLIDKNVSVGNLKAVLNYFAKEYFGAERETRLRPYHFRFTEPSFEVDISCGVCKGKGCRLCKGGWMELGGAGMVHPAVLKNGGVDPNEYNGFAFGWGVERTFLMKSNVNIPDIRMLYKNDIRFLEQF